MKKILPLLLIFVSLNCAAQTVNHDSLALRNAMRLDGIQTNLLRFSKPFETGTALILGGIVCTVAGTVFSSTNKPDKNGKIDDTTPMVMIVGGGALILSGWIIQQAAHRFIKRAGRVK